MCAFQYVFLRIQNQLLIDSLQNNQTNIQLSEKLEAKNSELEAANSSQARYLSTASHDLRQPLHALSLIATDMQATNTNAILNPTLSRMDQAIDSLSKSFDTMLNLSRLDSGVMHFRVIAMPVQKLLDRIQLEFEDTARHKNLKLMTQHSTAWVMADEGILYSIISNLVSNAIRYTETGGVLVGVRHVQGNVHLCVYDTGIGIEPEKTRSIFEEYQRLDYAKQRVRGGVGLGLAISERMAILLNAKLFVHSQLNKGSVFGIQLSRVQPDTHHLQAEPIETSVDYLSGKRVAIAEDDSDSLDELYKLIHSWGMHVSIVPTAHDFVMLCKTEGVFDIVITDHHLGMNKETGLEMLHSICAIQAHKPPVCVLLTGDTTGELMEIANEAHYIVLHKPVRPARLRSTLNTLVYQAEQREQHNIP